MAIVAEYKIGNTICEVDNTYCMNVTQEEIQRKIDYIVKLAVNAEVERIKRTGNQESIVIAV